MIRSLKLYINELWKEENLVDISVPSYLTINAKLTNPKSLKKITTRLNKINFIESYSVNELNKSYAKIKIRYLGKIKNLQDGFTKNGFEFQIIHNQWVLSIPS